MSNFAELLPDQIRSLRDRNPTAYLPVGCLEWHGPALPFGTDILIPCGLAQAVAERAGGVVFPPVVYGDPRHILQECRVEWREEYCREMNLPASLPGAFPMQDMDGRPANAIPAQADDGPSPAEWLPFDLEGQLKFFRLVVAQALMTIHLYGFRKCILLPGHGPMPQLCNRASSIYAQNVRRRKALGNPMDVETWFWIYAAQEGREELSRHSLHADRTELSLLLHLWPGLADPTQLPQEGPAPGYLQHPYLLPSGQWNPHYGELYENFTALDPRKASAEWGRELAGELVESLAARITSVTARPLEK